MRIRTRIEKFTTRPVILGALVAALALSCPSAPAVAQTATPAIMATPLEGPNGVLIKTGSALCTLNPGSIATDANELDGCTVPGAQVGDIAVVQRATPTTDTLNLSVCSAGVPAAGQVQWRLCNNTAGAVDAGNTVFSVVTYRSR